MSDTPRPGTVHSEDRGREGEGAAATLPAPGRKAIYLRTVYPLNPGIPHYLDFPQREG